MAWLISLLASSSLLLLFVVIGVGFLLGEARVAGFSLGPAAVLFAGIAFGALDPRLRVPELVYVLGLVMFVYTVGVQSGPSFFGSFGRRSLRANLLTVTVIALAAGLAVAARRLLGLPAAEMAGVFCGALTNTPALAAAIDAVRRSTEGTDAAAAVVNGPVIGYGIAYPFGVIGVLLGFHGVSRWRAARGRGAPTPASAASFEKVSPRTFRVTRAAATGVPVAELLSGEEHPGFVLSRMRRGDDTTLVYGDTRFAEGDLVVAVGTAAALQRAQLLLGDPLPRELHREGDELDFRRIEVSDPRVVGRRIAELNLQEMLDTTITRIRRGDVDIVPTGDTVLERGDWVRVLTWAGNVDRLRRYFGDSVRKASEADFLSVSIGLVAGVLLGLLPFPLPGGGHFALGFAGGPLLVGLLLGRLRRTGPIVWGVPFGVGMTLRQLGLVLFLAGVGTKAGDGLLRTLDHGGLRLALAGAVITLVTTLVVMVVGTRALGLSFAAAMGLMAGVQTQPACLAYANEHTPSSEPNVWYASVYPAAMIGKIVVAQLVVGWLLA